MTSGSGTSGSGTSGGTPLSGEQNPFLRYRERLDSYAGVTSGDLTDDEFVDLVADLNERVRVVWGHGFAISPLIDGSALAAASDVKSSLSIKVEAGGVGGSHKARHLMGVAIERLVVERRGHADSTQRLAIASCGNAALGAAVMARALDRELDVFVPTWADEVVVDQLHELGATVNRCERRHGESGDPCYLRFQEATAGGGAAFSVQGTDTPTTFDGGQTLGWEIAEQTDHVDALYVQVGGGALATAVSRGLPAARIMPVQAEGCAPLRRAWDRWVAAGQAAVSPEFMTPWQDPHSLATGILDDITYDWMPLLQRTRETNGHPIVATETAIEQAYVLAHAHTDVHVCSTGTAGFAGLLTEPAEVAEHVVVLFTGIDRT